MYGKYVMGLEEIADQIEFSSITDLSINSVSLFRLFLVRPYPINFGNIVEPSR